MPETNNNNSGYKAPADPIIRTREFSRRVMNEALMCTGDRGACTIGDAEDIISQVVRSRASVEAEERARRASDDGSGSTHRN
jgi:hypothetical protein